MFVAALLVKVMLDPAHRLEGPLIVGTPGDAFIVTTLFALVALQPAPFVTVTEKVPAVLTVMLWVFAPLLHTLPVELLLVKVMLDPAQTLEGPLIVGVTGGVSVVTTLFALVALHTPEETDTEYVPAALTEMLWVVCPPRLQVLPVALLLVSVMLVPWQ